MKHSTSAKIASLLKDMPHLFAPTQVPQSLPEEYVFVPIANAEDAVPNEQDALSETFAQSPKTPIDDDITTEQLEETIAQNLESFQQGIAPLDNLAETLQSNHAGGPIATGHFPGLPPTPDSLAFYLPFHFFAPTWWGIYLTVEGVGLVAREFVALSRGTLDPKSAVVAARLFLYYHEAYHHRIECFATRLEVSHRKPLYKLGFQSYFSSVFGTDDCIEEGLANAHAYLKTHRKLRLASADHAMQEIIRRSPPGYRLGLDISRRFNTAQATLAEANFHASLPGSPRADDRVWQSMGHLFDGLSNIRGRVNYVLHRSSPLVARARMRPLLPPAKLVKKLHETVTMHFVRHGANHDIYRTGDGSTVPIPRHPRDLNRGLLRKILKEAGIDMGLSEFLAD